MTDDSARTQTGEEERRQEHAAHWKRFDQVQRTIKLRHPKGVFRFKNFEEFNEWKEKHSIMVPHIAEKTQPEHDLP